MCPAGEVLGLMVDVVLKSKARVISDNDDGSFGNRVVKAHCGFTKMIWDGDG